MTEPPSYNGEYPRPLSRHERDWIEWILPQDRPAYRYYRTMIETMTVIGQGRRGKGEVILGPAGEKPDFSEPLAPVAAYGAIETTAGTISITLREQLNHQISVEIVSHQSDDIPQKFEEIRRWTYSTWETGQPCPQCLHNVRMVPMHVLASEKDHYVLAICVHDKRLWVYDSTSEMNRLIPLTNFYNELMLHKNIRDPNIALQAKRLFDDLPRYTDADLTYAFLTYNKIKTKIHIDGTLEADRRQQRGLRNILRNMFSAQR